MVLNALLALLLVLPVPVAEEPPAPSPEELAHRTATTVEVVHDEDNVSGSARGTGAVPEPWHSLAVCESGMNGEPRWSYNGDSGFDGGLQFHPRTWSAFAPDDYPAYAWQATPAQQVEVARKVQAAQGWGAWPKCSVEVGLR